MPYGRHDTGIRFRKRDTPEQEHYMHYTHYPDPLLATSSSTRTRSRSRGLDLRAMLDSETGSELLHDGILLAATGPATGATSAVTYGFSPPNSKMSVDIEALTNIANAQYIGEIHLTTPPLHPTRVERRKEQEG